MVTIIIIIIIIIIFFFFFFFLSIFIYFLYIDLPIQLTQSVLSHNFFNTGGFNLHRNHSESYSNSNLPEEYNRPSSLAGRAVEEAQDEESQSNVKIANLKCTICLSNPTSDTRLDCTICGKYDL